MKTQKITMIENEFNKKNVQNWESELEKLRASLYLVADLVYANCDDDAEQRLLIDSITKLDDFVQDCRIAVEFQ